MPPVVECDTEALETCILSSCMPRISRSSINVLPKTRTHALRGSKFRRSRALHIPNNIHWTRFYVAGPRISLWLRERNGRARQGSVRIGPVIISTKKKSRATLMNRQRRPPPGGRCQRLFPLLPHLVRLPFSPFLSPLCLSLFFFCQLSSATTGWAGPINANTRGTAQPRGYYNNRCRYAVSAQGCDARRRAGDPSRRGEERRGKERRLSRISILSTRVLLGWASLRDRMARVRS